MRKFVFFDTNSSRESDGIYPIQGPAGTISQLTEGELVTAYMLGEREFWDARIVRRGGQWGIELLSDARELSDDRYEGQQEVFGSACRSEWNAPCGCWKVWACPGS